MAFPWDDPWLLGSWTAGPYPGDGWITGGGRIMTRMIADPVPIHGNLIDWISYLL